MSWISLISFISPLRPQCASLPSLPFTIFLLSSPYIFIFNSICRTSWTISPSVWYVIVLLIFTRVHISWRIILTTWSQTSTTNIVRKSPIDVFVSIAIFTSF
nr:MAG TPA: hypothetical protein [Caudoviricetes sp.]